MKPAPKKNSSSTSPQVAYAQSRRRSRSEVSEDYVELIDDMITRMGEARAVDLARALGVSHVTVSKTVKRLIEADLVRSEPYRSIFLTEKGKSLASQSRQRHETVRQCLIAIGVPPRTADIDAEGIEHHASEATLQAMKDFLDRGGP